MRGEHELDPVEVRELLDELARRLRAAGVSAEIHVVGGSAMALTFPGDHETRFTRDVDAIIRPAAEVGRIVAAMADELGLSPGWLNSSAAPFVPPRVRGEAPADDVSVSVASVEELIAMKLAASREQDLHDLGILARHAGITEAERLVDIAFELYGDDSVVLSEPREDYLLLATQALRHTRRR